VSTDQQFLWEDEMARERTGHLPSYAMVKKMKLLALNSRRHSFSDD